MKIGVSWFKSGSRISHPLEANSAEMALDRKRDRERSEMGRLPGLDQRRRMARDGATGSEQDEHPAGLFDDTGPTREDVKSSEEGASLPDCSAIRHSQ